MAIAVAFGAEYALLLIYLRMAGFEVCDPFDSDRHGNWRYLLLPLTSFVCGRAMSCQCYLFLRLVILGAYTAVAIHLRQEEAVYDSLCKIFVCFLAVATGLWVLLLPAFVNSCHNLGVAFYSWSEDRVVPKRVTQFWYPFEHT